MILSLISNYDKTTNYSVIFFPETTTKKTQGKYVVLLQEDYV